jgi:hypothetical protein
MVGEGVKNRRSWAETYRREAAILSPARMVAPTWRTVKARLSLIDQRVQAVRREDAKAVRSLDATPGEYAATRSLEGVQIDHTQVDVIVVDEQHRQGNGPCASHGGASDPAAGCVSWPISQSR